ncbi:MAG: amino acid adenylation domain-containing protein [Bacteroidetes bacterium]|nr:amino acid adenylation domain-containing protein [Bacteroidota bacterium]
MKTIVELFENQAKQHPDRIALHFYGQEITFGELEAESAKIARRLRQEGVGKDSIVGLFIDRSPEMITGIFGILRAGGAYLPIDPAYPPERRNLIIANSGTGTILTSEKHRNSLPEGSFKVLTFGDISLTAQQADDPATRVNVMPDDLAYVIYTSGSTGIPKGVMIEHRALMTLLEGFNTVAPPGDAEVCLSVTPFTFDVSVWEFFISIPFGGSLHLLQTEDLINVQDFADYLFRNRIQCAYFPPSILSELVNAMEKREELFPLRRLLVGVEPIRQSILQRIRDKSEDLIVINGYGPTETTICATFYKFEHATEPDRRTPIGKAVPGYEVTLADENFHKAGPGESGQIVIGGPGLARGYLHDPELTDRKFIQDPFRADPSARIYLTGDTGRYLEDGNIEFAGRNDFQVKIRGYRVELGDIEAVVEKHPLITDNAVIDFDDGHVKKLRLFYTTRDNKALPASELRSFISHYLPGYMVPAYYRQLEKFPRTSAGKTDRKALKEMTFENLPDSHHVPPSNEAEQKLQNIWASVLDMNTISTDAGFATLGGDSIQAAMIISRISETFGISLNVQEFYEHSSIKETATILNSKSAHERQVIPAIPRNLPSYPLSVTQQELWFLHQMDEGRISHNIVLQIKIEGTLNREILRKSIQIIIRRFEDLRTSFPVQDGLPVQVIHEDSPLDLPFSDLHHDPLNHAKTQKILDELAHHIFDLELCPLYRFHLVRMEEELYYLNFSIHHIIFDGWSMGVLFRALKEIYSSVADGTQALSGQLRIQNVDYAEWQWNEYRSGHMGPEKEYWERVLTPRPDPAGLFRNKSRREGPGSGKRYWWIIPEEVSGQVSKLAARYQTSPFITLLSVYFILLHKYLNEDRILVGTPYANRKPSETEDLIGYFTNMISLVGEIKPGMGFEEFLQEVHKAGMGAYSNTAYPFGQLVKDLGIRTENNVHPVFQALFIMQNWYNPEMEFSGLKVLQKEMGNRSSKFDLTLNIEKVKEGLECWMEYDTSLFQETEIKDLSEGFNRLLGAVLINPLSAIKELESGIESLSVNTCYLMGDGNTLNLCAATLLRQGWKINGIISSDPDTVVWARMHNTAILSPRKDITNILKDKQFDYLFSINNSYIIPGELIQVPEKGCINYHNSLLPLNAGLFASHYAIRNGEAFHGITWHYVISEIDAGDILIQKSFPVNDRDVASSLDLRSFELAVSSFEELINGLTEGTLVPQRQDLSLRTYHGKYERPDNACVISWNQTAEQIDALYRSLTFRGKFDNDLGTPKLWKENNLFIIEKLRISEHARGKYPGMITGCDHGEITIGTQTRDIIIEKIRTIDGEPLVMEDFCRPAGVRPAGRMPEIPKPDSVLLTATYRESARKEPYWIRQLARAERFQFPLEDGSLDEIILETGKDNSEEASIALVSVFLARLSGNPSLTLVMDAASPGSNRKWMDILYSPLVPLNIKTDPHISCSENIGVISGMIRRNKESFSFAKDIYYRHPRLQRTSWQDNCRIRYEKGKVILQLISEKVSTESRELFQECFKAFHLHQQKHPEKILRDIPLIPVSLEKLILEDWNNTDMEVPAGLTFPELFRQKAEKSPDAIALQFEDTMLTYRELDEASGRLAQYLLSLGLSQPFLAGLLIDRSPAMIITILGILKAGGAYVPLDTKYPAERINLICEETGFRIVLTNRKYLEKLPESIRHILVAEELIPDLSQEDIQDRLPEIRQDNPAYVIFTSGSTGKPKGVVVSHGALISFTLATIANYRLGAGDRMLQFASITFDAAAEEIFPTLSSGGCLVLRTEDMISSAESFTEFCKKHRITILDLPTAYWHNISGEIIRKGLSFEKAMRLIILGGEAAKKENLLQWMAYAGTHPQVVNTYGPTETTVVATAYFAGEEVKTFDSVPIGRPIGNVKTYIVDSYGNLMPPGVAGELWIGGKSIASGYLNNPQLTGEKFIPDPFGLPGSRVYRSGDLAAFYPGGNLKFIGRTDNQIKIRGFRIEPGEVDAVAAGMKKLAQSYTMPVREQDRLVFYYTVKEGYSLSEEEIREYLKTRLPDFMVPSAFIRLESFPLTTSLKIDPKALPAPENKQTGAREILLPANETEENLYNIWKEILKTGGFSVSDSFFDLGGDSLSAIIFLSRLSDIYGELSIPLRELYAHPDIRSFSRLLVPEKDKASLDEERKSNLHLARIQPQGRLAPLVMIYGESANNYLPKLLGRERPYWAFIPQGSDGERIRLKTVEAIASAYADELTEEVKAEEFVVAGYSFGGLVAIETSRKLAEKGKNVKSVILIDTLTPLLWNAQKHKVTFTRKLRRMKFRWIRRISIILGKKVPEKYRNFYILERFNAAYKKYTPPDYPMNIHLIRSEKSLHPDPLLGWEQFGNLNIKVHNIPGDHHSIIRDPELMKITAGTILDILGS